MDNQTSRETLLKRIADLEAALRQQRSDGYAAISGDRFDLKDLMHATDGICVCHPIEAFPHVCFTFWNRRMVDLTGYEIEEINAKGWYQSVYPDPEVQIRAKARMGMMREGINLEAEEWEITRADGDKRNLRISTSMLAPDSETPSVLAIMQDVTSFRQSERLLRKEHQQLQRELEHRATLLSDTDRTLKARDARYRALFERATDAIFIENDRDEILEVNPRACELLGYTREALIGMTVPDIQAPECRGEKGKVLRGELEDHHGKPFEAVDLHKDGTRIPVEVTNNRLDEKGLFLSIVRDIRERKAAEEARREVYHILEKSPVVAFLWRNAPDWPVEYVTPNVSRIFGYSAEDFLTGRIFYSKVVHPDDLERVAGEVEAFSRDAGRFEFTHAPYRIVTRDGDTRWIADSTFIRRDPAGTITHYQGIVTDITDRIRAEEALSREKERLAVTLRSIGDAVITTDCNGRIALMNPIAESLTGWQEADAVGRPLMEVFRIVKESTREPRSNPVEQVLESGQIVGLANHTMLLARDGREFIIADSGAPIVDAEGAIIGVVLVFRDTTDRLQLEKELLKMEKLQSLGVLAGGIAHDFNNFLTGIIGNLSLAKLDLHSGNPINRALEEMEKAALRAKDLTQQLLTFSKGGDPVKHTADIAGLVRDAAQFALRGSNVRCDIRIDENLRFSEVDEGQIAQVLHNLILNADQAMPDGGTITLRGDNIALPPDNPFALAPGDYIQFSIEDQGMGIHPDHLKKVFDPYFTTKQKGSGLGLAVAYSIITKHDGQLTVDSRLGKGTTFTILLPASDRPVKRAAEDNRQSAAGQGFILVMDDEDFIRDLAQRMLTKMGYRVDVARDGQAALDRYRQAKKDGEPFDAVILDLTVPGAMGGKETLDNLKKADPKVRAVVSSGYANDPIMAHHRDYGFCGAVKKPYLLEDLSQVLEAVLKGVSHKRS